MKGDFSWFDYQPFDNFTGVLEQVGRVRLDRDGLASEEITRHLRTLMGRDTFGPGRVAVPAEASGSFRITAAASDGDRVTVTYDPGRAWIDGIPLLSNAEITTEASYLPPPFQPEVGAESIAEGVRDAVIMEVWEDSISAFLEPDSLLEPALGGVDTTGRVRVCHRLRLRRLREDEDCATIGPSLRDDPATKGRLTVTPAPAIAIGGDCPVEAGGGYSGDGHWLYCIEIARPRGNRPRFLWSRHGGGLVGRGRFDSVEQTISITHNRPMIDAANVSGMTLQAYAPEGESGCWQVVFEATVSMTDDVLSVSDTFGNWPAGPGEHAFFRLWDGEGEIADFAGPADLVDGIRLDFDAPNGENYREGDRWIFQVRAAGTDFDPSNWPNNALPDAIRYHRAPLGILNWSGTPPAELGPADIEDCRDSFPPLTDPCPCCTITVGDGRTTHGDEDSIEAAIERLPAAGGKICLLKGIHEANAVIRDRANIHIIGCGKDTRIVPRPGQRDIPIFHVIDSECIEIYNTQMISLGGVAVLGESTDDDALRQFLIRGNHIIACVRAIQIEGGSDIVIRENRIRMLDKRGAGVAVYIAAEDSRIEDNDIGVVPAEATPRPPDRPDDPDNPDDPNDPCADEETVYLNVGFFVSFVEFVLGFTLTAIVPPPYRALGGIQVAASTERLAILDNRILGGAGNGITLGGTHIPPEEEEPNGPVTQPLSLGRSVMALRGTVEDPDGNPAAGVTLQIRSPAGVVRSFTTSSTGVFEVRTSREQGDHILEPVTTGIGIEEVEVLQVVNLGAGSIVVLRVQLNRQRETADPRLGFLYGIRIEDNDITAMGLNGIGIPPALDVLEPEEDPDRPDPIGPGDFTVNPNFASARQPRFAMARASAVNPLLALLGHPVIDLTILNNRIAGNLRTPFTTAMRDAARLLGFGGISLGLCETVAIMANRIETNGRRHIDPVCGIFILFGEQVEITDNLIRDNGPFVNSDDEVVQGLRGGIAGIFLSIGLDDFGADDNRGSLTVKPALRVHDNVVQQPLGRTMTVLAAGPVSIVANHLTAERTGPQNLDRMAGAILLMSLSGVGRLPSGGCLINSNQISLGPDSDAMIALALAVAEDLGFDANQIDALQGGLRIGNRTLMMNTLLFAQTVRATGNRFREPLLSPEVALQVSLASLSTRMNIATSNEGDHCIYAFDMGTPARLVNEHNLVYDNTHCAELGASAAGAALNPTLGTATLESLEFVNALESPTGVGLSYAASLDENLVSLNGYQRNQIEMAAEYKSANAALLGNEVARMEARSSARSDLLEANRKRLGTITRDVERFRAAEEIVGTRPEPVREEVALRVQGRVTDARGAGLPLAEVRLGDARGQLLDIVQAAQTNEKGGYAIELTQEEFKELGATLKRGATVTASLEGRDVKPVRSAVFKIDSTAVLAPDIRFVLDSDARRVQPTEPRPGRTDPTIRRPVLRGETRLRSTSGRIAPLLRESRRSPKGDD